jgi:hypothetical protein
MKTLGPCSCRPGIARDNCPQCEGTGRRIDFAAHRAAVRESLAIKAHLATHNALARARRRDEAADFVIFRLLARCSGKLNARGRHLIYARHIEQPLNLPAPADRPDAFASRYCAGCVEN